MRQAIALLFILWVCLFQYQAASLRSIFTKKMGCCLRLPYLFVPRHIKLDMSFMDPQTTSPAKLLFSKRNCAPASLLAFQSRTTVLFNLILCKHIYMPCFPIRQFDENLTSKVHPQTNLIWLHFYFLFPHTWYCRYIYIHRFFLLIKWALFCPCTHLFFCDYLWAAPFFGNRPEIMLFLDMFGCGPVLIIASLLFVYFFMFSLQT